MQNGDSVDPWVMGRYARYASVMHYGLQEVWVKGEWTVSTLDCYRSECVVGLD